MTLAREFVELMMLVPPVEGWRTKASEHLFAIIEAVRNGETATEQELLDALAERKR